MTSKKTGEKLVLLTGLHSLSHVFPATLPALLPFIRLEYRLSYSMIGIIMFTFGWIWGIGSIFAGTISDRVNKINFISLMFLSIGIFAGLLFLMNKLILILTLLGFISFSLSIFHPSAQSWLSGRYRSSENRGRIFGIYDTGGNLGMIIAPVVAVFIGSKFGWRSVYGIWAIPMALAALLVYIMLRSQDSKAKPRTSQSFARQFMSSLKSTCSHGTLKFIFLIQGFIDFLLGGVMTFVPLLIVDSRILTAETAGYFFALYLGVGAIGKIMGGICSDVWGRRKTMSICFLSMASLSAIIPFIRGSLLIILLLVSGMVLFMTVPVNITILGEEADKNLGFNYGLFGLVGAGFGATSKLFSGVIGDIFGIKYIFLMFTGIALLASVISFFPTSTKD